jgi:HEPN domain-containing protein
MGLPKPAEARLYYRAGKQRFDDAQLLLQEDRTTGAVYLAGYTVECLLKALILASLPPARRRNLLTEFRGGRGHAIEWLGTLYRKQVGATIPRDITKHLARIASWSTDLRYAVGSLKRSDAEEFMNSVVAVADWADGRM